MAKATDVAGTQEEALSEREQALERRENALRETLRGAQAELMSREQALVEREKKVLEQERDLQKMQQEIEDKRTAMQTREQELEQIQQRLQSEKGSAVAREGGDASSSAKLEQLTDMVAKLTEALNQARNSGHEASERCGKFEAEVRDLKSELSRATYAAKAAEARLSHQEKSMHEPSRSSLDEQVSKQLAAQVDVMRAPSNASSMLGGGVAKAIAAALQDVELGNRSGVTLVDLGLADIRGIHEADNFLRVLAALMTVRADARLVVFGLWAICHLIYIAYIMYAHIFQRRACLH